MLFGTIADVVGSVVMSVGLPLLVVLCFLEGLIIGKLVQPPLVFVGVVAIAGPPLLALGLLVVACALAVTIGQWIIYQGLHPESNTRLHLRDRIPGLDTVATYSIDRIGQHRWQAVDHFFDRYGGLSIVLGTFLPGVRALIAIPAGISAYPTQRFVAANIIGNLGYFLLLGGIGYGTIQLVGL